MLATASVVAGDVSAHMTTNTGNTIATEHSHLMMCVLAGSSPSARSKFARECYIACGQYRISKTRCCKCYAMSVMIPY